MNRPCRHRAPTAEVLEDRLDLHIACEGVRLGGWAEDGRGFIHRDADGGGDITTRVVGVDRVGRRSLIDTRGPGDGPIPGVEVQSCGQCGMDRPCGHDPTGHVLDDGDHHRILGQHVRLGGGRQNRSRLIDRQGQGGTGIAPRIVGVDGVRRRGLVGIRRPCDRPVAGVEVQARGQCWVDRPRGNDPSAEVLEDGLDHRILGEDMRLAGGGERCLHLIDRDGDRGGIRAPGVVCVDRVGGGRLIHGGCPGDRSIRGIELKPARQGRMDLP